MISDQTQSWVSRWDDGQRMPWALFGTMEYEGDTECMYDAVMNALRAGYRHFDCAEIYESTPYVAKAFLDIDVPREDIWVTSKLKGLPLKEDNARNRVQTMLKELGLEYFDLLLIHWPGMEDFDFMADPDSQKCNADYYLSSVKNAWGIMHKLRNEGLAMKVGVSNFYRGHIEQLEPRPFANEIFVNVVAQEREFVEWMQSSAIKVLGYRPLAFMPALKMAEDMGDDTYAKVVAAAAENEISPHAFVLAWLASRGVFPIAKTKNPEFCKENLAALKEARLSGDELRELDGAEMAVMCGAIDEYALFFKSSSPTF